MKSIVGSGRNIKVWKEALKDINGSLLSIFRQKSQLTHIFIIDKQEANVDGLT